jgi:hypothetical protein
MCQLQNDPEKIRTKNYRSNMPPDSAFTYGLINTLGDKPATHFAGRIVMTTELHPSDVALFALAAGTLDDVQHVTIDDHVPGCAQCRAFVSAMEHVGGIVLDSLPPTPLAGGSLAEVMARIDRPETPADLPAFTARSRPGALGTSDHIISRRWFPGWNRVARAIQDGAGESCTHHPVCWDRFSGR